MYKEQTRIAQSRRRNVLNCQLGLGAKGKHAGATQSFAMKYAQQFLRIRATIMPEPAIIVIPEPAVVMPGFGEFKYPPKTVVAASLILSLSKWSLVKLASRAASDASCLRIRTSQSKIRRFRKPFASRSMDNATNVMTEIGVHHTG